jgi:hypothetical protein
MFFLVFDAKLDAPIDARDRAALTSLRALTTKPLSCVRHPLVLLSLPPRRHFVRVHAAQNEGKEITVEPGLILGEVNRLLAKYKQQNGLDVQYKMGPDPSSIDSCMIGGVVANNSSGMCCGVKQNTYHTLKDMRIVFVDGTGAGHGGCGEPRGVPQVAREARGGRREPGVARAGGQGAERAHHQEARHQVHDGVLHERARGPPGFGPRSRSSRG